MPKGGIAAGLSAVIVGQLVLSMILDYFGFFGLQSIPITPSRVFGVVLLLIGVRLMFLRGS